MFCPKCGSNIADGTRFCPTCGAPTAPAAPNYDRPAAPNYGRPANPGYGRPIGSFNYLEILTAYGMYAFAALCGVLAILFFTGSNLVNDGLKAIFKHGKYIGMEGLKTIGIITGIVWLAMAAYAVYVRSALVSNRPEAQNLLNKFLISMGSLFGVYYIVRMVYLAAKSSDLGGEYDLIGKDILCAVVYVALGFALSYANKYLIKQQSR